MGGHDGWTMIGGTPGGVVTVGSGTYASYTAWYRLYTAPLWSSVKVDSRLLVTSRLLRDFFLKSRQSSEKKNESRLFGQVLKPKSTV
jgi:hypothetical protein